ncbi:MAG: 50S ribosomal protein L9 [Candidatus Omnitrophica bacterium]|nr:50S ribosomal protein L9 [Candidatus Omnitrophota bacterium]MCM8791181.1 50S ribosomal protein L9 [Candidatus Omnitrophota bacterium]
MKVILTKDVDRLGKAGQVVTVKDGFARNYLIPKEMAKIATPGNMKWLEVLKKKEAAEEAKRLEAARALANRISNLSLTISVQAGEEEKLFGSVTNDAIADALKEEGLDIDKKDIILEEPIKKLGVYQVTVKVHPEVKASLRLWIVKK